MKTLTLAACALTLALSYLWAAPSAQDSAEPQLAELAWLGGHWSSEVDGQYVEEHWLAPRGGSMLGLHRDVDVAGDRTIGFEFLRIVQGQRGIRFLASPNGRPPTPFDLEDIAEGRVVFANPQHDFPQRLTYELEQDGKVLHVRAEGEGGKQLEWRWVRTD